MAGKLIFTLICLLTVARGHKLVELLHLQPYLEQCPCDYVQPNSYEPLELEFDFIGSTRNVLSDEIEAILKDASSHASVTLPALKIGEISLDDGVITGLDTMTYDVQGAGGFFVLNHLNIVIKALSLQGIYNINNVDIGIVVLWGNGALNITLEDLRFDLGFEAQVYGQSIIVKNVTAFELKMGNVTFDLENFIGGGPQGDLLMGIVESMLPFIIDIFGIDFAAHLGEDTCSPNLHLNVQCLLKQIVKFIMCSFLSSKIPILPKCNASYL